MLVPAVLNESTSPSPEKVPPTICTVAFARFRLSGSFTVTFDESVVEDAAFSVNCALGATLLSVGGSLTAVMLRVEVAAALWLFEAAPSLSTQVMVRLGFEPKFVGLSLAVVKVTLS